MVIILIFVENFHLERNAFIHLVNILLERESLDEGCFLKVVQIIATTLFILARGTSYRDVEVRFGHSPSTIGKYHNLVLQTLVNVSLDILMTYQSQLKVPPEIANSPIFF